MATAKTRQKVLNVFLDLLAETDYDRISLLMIADSAKLSLADLRQTYSSKRAMVEDFMVQIDKTVLDDLDEDMGDQPPRDRLFDILMKRIDALAENKDAVRALYDAARSDPGLALEFNRIAVRSQKWMLAGAGIELSGFKTGAVAQGMAIAFARVVDVWLKEDDEGMPRTMARLDKELDKGTSFMKQVGRAERAVKGLRSLAKKMSRKRRHRSDNENEFVPEDGISAV